MDESSAPDTQTLAEGLGGGGPLCSGTFLWRLGGASAGFSLFCSFFFIFFLLLELHLRRMEVPRLGIKSELQRLVYTTATAMQIQATSVTYTTAQSKA